MKKINRKIVAALIISNDNKILLGRKAKNSAYLDCWHIPGGDVEPGETDKEALIREVLKETGLDISQVNLQLVDAEGKGSHEKTLSSGEAVIVEMDFKVYRVDLDQIANKLLIKMGDDLVEGKWLELDKLHTVKHTPPSDVLFKKLSWT